MLRYSDAPIADYIENYFKLDGADVNRFISFSDRAKMIENIKNDDIISFANRFFTDQVGIVTMTQG